MHFPLTTNMYTYLHYNWSDKYIAVLLRESKQITHHVLNNNCNLITIIYYITIHRIYFIIAPISLKFIFENVKFFIFISIIITSIVKIVKKSQI